MTKQIIGRIPTLRGIYDENNTYYKDNIVTYNNTAYRCLVDNTNTIPTDETCWEVFVQSSEVNLDGYASKEYVDTTINSEVEHLHKELNGLLYGISDFSDELYFKNWKFNKDKSELLLFGDWATINNDELNSTINNNKTTLEKVFIFKHNLYNISGDLTFIEPSTNVLCFTDLDNVKGECNIIDTRSYICKYLNLTDKLKFNNPYEFTAERLYYKRNITFPNGFDYLESSFCFPFNFEIDKEDGNSYFLIDIQETNIKKKYIEDSIIHANFPFFSKIYSDLFEIDYQNIIIYKTENKLEICTVDDVVFFGNYSQKYVVGGGLQANDDTPNEDGLIASDCYYVTGNKFYYGNGRFNITPFRAFASLVNPITDNNAYKIPTIYSSVIDAANKANYDLFLINNTSQIVSNDFFAATAWNGFGYFNSNDLKKPGIYYTVLIGRPEGTESDETFVCRVTPLQKMDNGNYHNMLILYSLKYPGKSVYRWGTHNENKEFLYYGNWNELSSVNTPSSNKILDSPFNFDEDIEWVDGPIKEGTFSSIYDKNIIPLFAVQYGKKLENSIDYTSFKIVIEDSLYGVGICYIYLENGGAKRYIIKDCQLNGINGLSFAIYNDSGYITNKEKIYYYLGLNTHFSGNRAIKVSLFYSKNSIVDFCDPTNTKLTLDYRHDDFVTLKNSTTNYVDSAILNIVKQSTSNYVTSNQLSNYVTSNQLSNLTSSFSLLENKTNTSVEELTNKVNRLTSVVNQIDGVDAITKDSETTEIPDYDSQDTIWILKKTYKQTDNAVKLFNVNKNSTINSHGCKYVIGDLTLIFYPTVLDSKLISCKIIYINKGKNLYYLLYKNNQIYLYSDRVIKLDIQIYTYENYDVNTANVDFLDIYLPGSMYLEEYHIICDVSPDIYDIITFKPKNVYLNSDEHMNISEFCSKAYNKYLQQYTVNIKYISLCGGPCRNYFIDRFCTSKYKIGNAYIYCDKITYPLLTEPDANITNGGIPSYDWSDVLIVNAPNTLPGTDPEYFSLFSQCNTINYADWNFDGNPIALNRFKYLRSLRNFSGTVKNIKTDINLSYSPLTRDSALIFINGLVDTGTQHTIYLSDQTKSLLYDHDILLVINKNWTIA